MTTDVTLNGVALSTAVPTAQVLRPARHLVGKRRHRTADIPGRDGPWIFPERPGAGAVELDIAIDADTFADRRAAVSALADWCDLDDVAALIIADLPDRYYDAILDTDPTPSEWLNAAEVTLKFLTGPFALAVSTSSEAITATGAPADSGSFSIDDELAAEPVIEVTAVGGTVTEFSFTLNGDTLTYGGPTIAAGNTITISSIADTVTQGVNGDTMLTGAYTGLVLLADVAGTFPELAAGTNTWSLTWQGTATDVVLDISWRRRYR